MTKQTTEQPVTVSIRCTVYNHEPYLRDTLNGFVMQKTDFRFVAMVHDDASTDGSAAIIREYAEKYPDIIKPIFETENQYSKQNGSLGKVMRKACSNGKYVAYCEGDDYWIDENKLQMQVDFMEAHPDYSYCWTNVFKRKGDKVGRKRKRYGKDCTVPFGDIVMRGGAWVPTPTLLLRQDVFASYPQDDNFVIGDYPLQIWAAHKGKGYYFEKATAVYRINAPGSWSSKASAATLSQRLKKWQDFYYLVDKMNEYTGYEHDVYLRNRGYHYKYKEALEKKDYASAKYWWKKKERRFRRGVSDRAFGNGCVGLGKFLVWIRKTF